MQTGSPRELYERPTEIFVARFLGRNNLITARRLSPSDERRARSSPWRRPHAISFRPAQEGRVRDQPEHDDSIRRNISS